MTSFIYTDLDRFCPLHLELDASQGVETLSIMTQF